MDDRERIQHLENKLAAREKTISVLMTRVEETLNTKYTSFAVFEQNIALERIVASKTRQLEAKRADLEQAVSKLQATQTQLLHAQKLEAIGQLAAGIAHEINTPTQYVADNVTFLGKAFEKLGDVVNLAEEFTRTDTAGAWTDDALAAARTRLARAKIGYLREQIPKAIGQSREGIERIATIVKAMKEFSHPSEGSKQAINLQQAIETTITVARNEWKYVAELATDFDENLPPVPCLRDELNQVVLNLIVNAAHAIAESTSDATAGKGTITVRTRSLGQWAEISIADTGGGIPEAAQPRIFDPFFTTKAVGKGTGQGLAIAYSVIVDKHGGTITFDTKQGVGTTFYIRIPLGNDDSNVQLEGHP